MKTQPLPCDQWQSFFDQFSRDHRCKRTSIETISPEHGVLFNARNLPLVGITAERSTSGDVTRLLEIIVGDPRSTANITRTIRNPTRVSVAESPDGKCASVEIESEERLVTIVHVGRRIATRPLKFLIDEAPTPAAPAAARGSRARRAASE
jgi:hypothetical protein